MRVVERFVSINGEGSRAGELAVFIRFKGCNLSCSYCDTAWANDIDVAYEEMTPDEICDYVSSLGIRNVTITGGEPLIQPDIDTLIDELLRDPLLDIEIETDGAVDITPYLRERVSITMDYKLASSGMERMMLTDNLSRLRACDTLKLVVGDRDDLIRSLELVKMYNLIGRCNIYYSPVYGSIEPSEIVDFMKDNKLNDVRLQLQLHKIIYGSDTRGV